MTIHIIRGQVTDPTVYPFSSAPKLGAAEWQFSDGPSGQRRGSADYLSLRAGLLAHLGQNFNLDEADFTPEEQALFDETVGIPDAD